MWCVCLFDDMLSIFIYSSQSWETKAVLLKTLCAMESSIELKLFYILITTFECEVIGVAYTQSKKVICLLKKKTLSGNPPTSAHLNLVYKVCPSAAWLGYSFHMCDVRVRVS